MIKQYEIESMSAMMGLSTERGELLSEKMRVGVESEKSNYKHHRLNVNAINYVPKEHLVVSAGYDQYLYGF